MAEAFDTVVIGAGSIGLPTSLFLAEAGLKVAVVDFRPSPGQGENKAAIGGVRATHSDPAKILLCKKSLEIFQSWEDLRDSTIGWKRGGYLFPVYREDDKKVLLDLLPIQKKYDLLIDWIDRDEVAELVPGIREGGLLGGTWSPGDGQVSPLLASRAFHNAAVRAGCRFFFGNRVTGISISSGKVTGACLSGGIKLSAPVVVNAAGADAAQVSALADISIPVQPEVHEAGITAPLAQFLLPLIVDMRPGNDSETANFYFGQNHEGAVIFCYTPLSPKISPQREVTSKFLPAVSRRLISLLPRLQYAPVRRTWAGHYPMTPDGLPVLGESGRVKGFFMASGMCGQGFMLGPGIGKVLTALIVNGRTDIPEDVLDTLSPERAFAVGKAEVLT